MILFELETELRNLRMAFPRAEFKQEEFLVWFKKFKHWSLNRFQTTLDRLIESEDRFPSISKVMQAGRDYNEDQLSKVPKTNCDHCLSSGIVYAMREGYRFAFRCNDCRNWDGYFGERVPLWSPLYIGQGYQPTKEKQVFQIPKPESDEWLDAI